MKARGTVWLCRECMHRRNVWATYGLTPEHYEAMLAQQNYRCRICGLPESESVVGGRKGGARRLCVDHCHRTGKVRALLCLRCNTAVGTVKDCPEQAKRLAEYLIAVAEEEA